MEKGIGLRRAAQRGVAAVEFALIAAIFIGLIFVIVDFGRWLFAMNAAAEATRWGARLAVVCDVGSTTPKNCMKKILPGLTDAQIAISYTCDTPPCTASNTKAASVQINGMTLSRVLAPQPGPFEPIRDMPLGSFLNLPIGSFPTRLTREMMATTWVCNCP